MPSPNSTFTSSVLTTGQMNNLPFGKVTYQRNTTATATRTTVGQTSFMSATPFTPVSGRLYQITYGVGFQQNTAGGFNQEIRLYRDAGTTLLDTILQSASPAGFINSPQKTIVLDTSAGQLGTSSVTLYVYVYLNGSGNCTWTNNTTYPGFLTVTDIGLA